MDRANIDIIRGQINGIDVEEKMMLVKGMRKPIRFDKLLVAYGAERDKLEKNYANVHYLEDRFSHAKMHNQLLKSNKIVVLGNTFEAFQVASAAREYLDGLGFFEKQIILMTTEQSEVRKTLGTAVEKYLAHLLRQQRITF